MSPISPSQFVSRQDQPIVIDDDDEDDNGVASTSVRHPPAQSPTTSLRGITPAMSVATTSTSSINPADERNSASGPPSSLDRYRTGYVYSADMMLHVNPIDPDHPERPLRIFKIFMKFKENNLFARMKRVPIREVAEEEVKLVHDHGIWEGVQRLAFYHPDVLKEQVQLLETNSSLYINEHSAYAARLSCGGAIELVNAVAAGQIQNGFAIVRPPGHHAEPQKSMGFCFFNNVAVATRVVLRRHAHIKKVLILDWDVHHGNGTQRAFEYDDNVLYISLHRYDEDGSFYPGSTYGNFDSAGTGPGEGRSVNIPWLSQGMGDADYLYAFNHLVMPIAHEFQPDLVIISAGFDAADGDPIGLNRVSPGGFAQMTHLLTSLSQGKVAVVLEGGYNPEAVASSALAVVDVLLSRNTAEPLETVASTSAAATVHCVRRFHQKWWKSLRSSPLEADEADIAVAPIDVGRILAAFRTETVAQQYDLLEVPLQHTPHSRFGGQVLVSDRILDKFSTILFFVHDMGNWRSERPQPSMRAEQMALQLVDASRGIMDYARARGFGLVDVNINREFSTTRLKLPPGVREPPRHDEEASATAAFIWDNVVSLATGPVGPPKIVMVGFGSGCRALTSIIDERNVELCVHAIVNVVGYEDMPHLALAAGVEKKKWYYRRTMVLAPADHRHLVERADAAPLKRFGRITPVHDTAAINILAHKTADIQTFIDKKLQVAKKSTSTTL